MDFKREEIIDYINEQLDCYEDNGDDIYNLDEETGEMDWSEIHNDLFNDVYFITSRVKAEEWFENVGTYVQVQRFVYRYFQTNYGMDERWLAKILDPRNVVNHYAYIIGEEELPKILQQRYKEEIGEVLEECLSNNESRLIDRIWTYFDWF